MKIVQRNNDMKFDEFSGESETKQQHFLEHSKKTVDDKEDQKHSNAINSWLKVLED